MDLIRRNIIKLTGVVAGLGYFLKPVLAWAKWNEKAFSSSTESDALANFFPGAIIHPSEAIKITAQDLVENGAVVPIKVETDLADVSSITILVEKNPNPLIANFNLGQGCEGFIATRIKVGQPSDIVIIVKSQDKLYSRRKFVEVVEGGCG